MQNLTYSLKNKIISYRYVLGTALQVRGFINRLLKSADSYIQEENMVKPLSTKFGFDRGKPIDRYWIEKFLNENRSYIKGICLEIGDYYYTEKFGKNTVERADILDIDSANNKASITGDLKNLKKVIKDETYDCVILTHVLGLIDDIDSAVSEVHRILKKGGVVLATSACISPTYNDVKNYWRILPEGANYLFSKHFREENISVKPFGNVLSGQHFWAGLAQEDVQRSELEYNDPQFPCIVSVRAIK